MSFGQHCEALKGWLFPATCIVCGGAGTFRDLCRGCAIVLPWNQDCCERCALPLPDGSLCGICATHPPHWDRVRSPLVYEFPVDSLLRQFKFAGRLSHGRVLGELLAEWIASFDEPLPDMLIPVPLHWQRQLKRRFNQAEEITRPLHRRLKIPVANLCRRRYPTPQQSGLSGRERRRNLRDAFVMRGNVTGAHIAVVDDVMTTGSTVTEISRVLLRAGAARVEVWTVARVPKPGMGRGH